MKNKNKIEYGTVVKYLDYDIVYTTDGWVITKSGGGWECNLGNFGDDLEAAKKSATVHFMIARPEKFHQQIHNRIMFDASSGCMHEWFTLRNVLRDEKIEMPVELSEPIDSMNAMIGYNGKYLNWKNSNLQ